MVRKINIEKEHFFKDLDSILFENGNHSVFRMIDGYTPPEEARHYLIALAHEAYCAGLHRLETEWNRQQDREVSQAQTKAIHKLIKMAEKKEV